MNLLYQSNCGVMMECQIRITYDELHAQDAYQTYKNFALSSKEWNIIIYTQQKNHEREYSKYKKCEDLQHGLCNSWILHIIIFACYLNSSIKILTHWRYIYIFVYMYLKYLKKNLFPNHDPLWTSYRHKNMKT